MYIRFLGTFLAMAEYNYLVGFRVHYYIFSDQPQEVPAIPLASGMSLNLILVPRREDSKRGPLPVLSGLHLSYYYESRDKFPYECSPASLSFVPLNERDFYYAGAVFGGTVEEVHKLTRTCQEHLDRDRVNGIEAAWQEERHLNLYLIYNKPTRLLSPEYIYGTTEGVMMHLRSRS
ncbi:unnamed protein product, partial [Coregonus sp. 'balchen']